MTVGTAAAKADSVSIFTNGAPLANWRSKRSGEVANKRLQPEENSDASEKKRAQVRERLEDSTEDGK